MKCYTAIKLQRFHRCEPLGREIEEGGTKATRDGPPLMFPGKVTAYLTTAQAMRFPLLPLGLVVISSAFS